MYSNKRSIDNADGFPSSKRGKFGSNNNRGRGSFRGGSGFNRGRGGFNRGRGGFNRGGNRGRGGFQSFSRNGNFPSRTNQIKANSLKVIFPNSQESVKPILSKVLKNCDQVLSTGDLNTWWNPQDLIKKLPLLKEIKINNEPIKFTVSSQSESENKKCVSIPNRFKFEVVKDNITKVFKADSISKSPDNSLQHDNYILTYTSGEEASEAAKIVMKTDKEIIRLKPYYEDKVFCTDGIKDIEELKEKLISLTKEIPNNHGGAEENNMETDEEDEEDDEEEEVEEGDDDDGEEEEDDDDDDEEEEEEEKEDNDANDDEGGEEEEDDDDDDDGEEEEDDN